MTEKKYELALDTTMTIFDEVRGNVKLFRIRALRSIETARRIIRKGELGGWVETNENLSHSGNCWIFNDAIAYGRARICEDAALFHSAKVRDRAYVGGTSCINDEAVVCGSARVEGDSHVFGTAKCVNMALVIDAYVYGDAVIGDHAVINGAYVSGNASVFGHANITSGASIKGHAKVFGHAVVSGANIRVTDEAEVRDYAVVSGRKFREDEISDENTAPKMCVIGENATISGNAVVHQCDVSGEATITDDARVNHAIVTGEAAIGGHALVIQILDRPIIDGNALIRGDAEVSINIGSDARLTSGIYSPRNSVVSPPGEML